MSLVTAASLAEVPVDVRALYESEDQNYPLFIAAVINKVASYRSEAMRKAESQPHG